MSYSVIPDKFIKSLNFSNNCILENFSRTVVTCFNDHQSWNMDHSEQNVQTNIHSLLVDGLSAINVCWLVRMKVSEATCRWGSYRESYKDLRKFWFVEYESYVRTPLIPALNHGVAFYYAHFKTPFLRRLLCASTLLLHL